tara:strand:+ start:284 stop:460 length:177 start_codon:yes stop_codon:yes gene_type:complete
MSIKYELKHKKVIPREKFKVLFGLIICQKKGILNNNTGYALIPFMSVNNNVVTAIKYK